MDRTGTAEANRVGFEAGTGEGAEKGAGPDMRAGPEKGAGSDKGGAVRGADGAGSAATPSLGDRLLQCRARTLALGDGLTDADATVQSMDDASPAKWHLAHTTWFFEEFVLGPFGRNYEPCDARYRFLFNSYYEAVGPRHPRPRRGMLTRPRLDEIVAYRLHVDESLRRLLREALTPPARALIELGIQHEQQHQELLLTDVLHLFAQNPLRPAYRGCTPSPPSAPGSPGPGVSAASRLPGWSFPGAASRSGTPGKALPSTANCPATARCSSPTRWPPTR